MLMLLAYPHVKKHLLKSTPPPPLAGPSETETQPNMEAGNMSEAVFSDLCRRIRQNDPLTKSLTVDGNDTAKAKLLFDCLGSNTELRRLGLDFSSELPVSLPLLDYLANSPTLRIFDLFGIDMTKNATCTVLLLLLKKVSKNPAMKELTLHGANLKRTLFQRVTSVFSGGPRDIFVLQSGIASSFHQMKYLHSLWLEHLDGVVLAQLLPSLRHLLRLHTLTVVPTEKESLDLFSAIGALITSSRSLRSLVLYDCFLSGKVMKPLAEGIRHSDTFTHLALHTSTFDIEGVEFLQELYAGYLTGLTIGLDVALADPLSEILLNENSTLVSLDVQHSGPDERKKVLSTINGKVDQLEAFVNFLLQTVQGDVGMDIQKPEVPVLEELTWSPIKSEEELGALELALSAMKGLRKFHVDIIDRLDPVGLLRACKSGSVESCVINGQVYDLKVRSTEAKAKPNKKIKRVRRRKEDETVDLPVEQDGIGLEAFLFETVDTPGDAKRIGDYDADLECDNDYDTGGDGSVFCGDDDEGERFHDDNHNADKLGMHSNDQRDPEKHGPHKPVGPSDPLSSNSRHSSSKEKRRRKNNTRSFSRQTSARGERLGADPSRAPGGDVVNGMNPGDASDSPGTSDPLSSNSRHSGQNEKRSRKKSTKRFSRQTSARGKRLGADPSQPRGGAFGNGATVEADIGDFHSCDSGRWESGDSMGFKSADQGPAFMYEATSPGQQSVGRDKKDRSSHSRSSRHSRGSNYSRGSGHRRDKPKKDKKKSSSRHTSKSVQGPIECAGGGPPISGSTIETNTASSSSSTIDIDFVTSAAKAFNVNP